MRLLFLLVLFCVVAAAVLADSDGQLLGKMKPSAHEHGQSGQKMDDREHRMRVRRSSAEDWLKQQTVPQGKWEHQNPCTDIKCGRD